MSGETRELAGFLDTGLDLSTDSVTEGERERTLAWYREHHDHGDLDLAPFIRYQMNHDPASFKRLRRHLFALGREPEDRPLPIVAAVLLYVYSYAVLGNGKGTLYEVVAARALGVTRAQAVETLALATLQGGPLAVNAFADYCDEYIAGWPEDEGGVPLARRLGARCRSPPLRHRPRHGHARAGRARADHAAGTSG